METQKRTLLKTAIYRGFTTIILFITSWLYTGNFIESSFITIVFNILATIFYYTHERMWCKTSWGITQSENILNTKNLKT
ncbi:MAG TPA: DUF2061 domain-containing protein [Nitrosopumilaceae archaeon]|nr:DUF2061 domain-containing protein [Nitrosopumilaceae archaeon]